MQWSGTLDLAIGTSQESREWIKGDLPSKDEIPHEIANMSRDIAQLMVFVDELLQERNELKEYLKGR